MSKSADDALEAGVRIKALPLGHCDATLVGTQCWLLFWCWKLLHC